MIFLSRFTLSVLLSVALGSGAPTYGAAGAEPAVVDPMFVGDLYENFRHVDRFHPTAKIPQNEHPGTLPRAEREIRFSIDYLGQPTDLETYIANTNTSSFLVLKEGAVVYEHYGRGDSPESLHFSFSMAKSIVSALVGIAVAEGRIKSIDDPTRNYLPELTSPTFDGVTIKHVLEMSSGIRFNEDYTNPEADINKMARAVKKVSYLEYINTLGRSHEPGTYNNYASVNTQLLGILLVRATGQSLTEYTHQKLWLPLGMEQGGNWMLDADGFELAMGGLSASARDYARIGQLFLQLGRWQDTQVIPEAWVREAVTPDAPHLMPGENPQSSNTSGYKYQWWTPREPDGGDFLARGMWGQYIYVHPVNKVVIVRLSADPDNFRPDIKQANVDYVQALGISLSN